MSDLQWKDEDLPPYPLSMIPSIICLALSFPFSPLTYPVKRLLVPERIAAAVIETSRQPRRQPVRRILPIWQSMGRWERW